MRNEKKKKNTKVVSFRADLMAFHFLRRISHISPTPNMDESMVGKTAPSLSATARYDRTGSLALRLGTGGDEDNTSMIPVGGFRRVSNDLLGLFFDSMKKKKIEEKLSGPRKRSHETSVNVRG